MKRTPTEAPTEAKHDMAKWGEGDARWIVNEREDGTNINGWHWEVRARARNDDERTNDDDVLDDGAAPAEEGSRSTR